VVMLYEMIEHLPVTDRNIILLYLGHYTEKEIAQIVGKSTAAVKQQINRIKNKLRKQYEKNFKNRG
jgi:RNA polymerase sigma factor (sigma-70 family)